MSNVLNKLDEEFTSLEEETPVVKLNEEAFKSLYLPYITGEKQSDNLLVKWVELSGSPFKPVELVNNDGEVVNVIPPLIDKTLNGENDKSLDNLSAAITEGKLQEDTYGASQTISRTVDNIAKNMGSLSKSKEWQEALKPYISETEPVEKTHTSSVDDEDEIELEF